jgi:hypothetical protein
MDSEGEKDRVYPYRYGVAIHLKIEPRIDFYKWAGLSDHKRNYTFIIS